jgi:pyruvate decarboxylase
MKSLLPKLTQRLAKFKDMAKEIAVPKFELPVPKEDDDVISHSSVILVLTPMTPI